VDASSKKQKPTTKGALMKRENKIELTELQTLRMEVLEETGASFSKIKCPKIRKLLKEGFGCEEVVAMYKVSYLDSCGSKRPIPIDHLGEFAEIFLGKEFTEEELSSTVDYLRSIYQNSKYNGGKRYCTSKLIRQAIDLAKEHGLDDLGDMQDILVESFVRGSMNSVEQDCSHIGMIDPDEEPNRICELTECGRPAY